MGAAAGGPRGRAPLRGRKGFAEACWAAHFGGRARVRRPGKRRGEGVGGEWHFSEMARVSHFCAGAVLGPGSLFGGAELAEPRLG
jgi:hypothetical protein